MNVLVLMYCLKLTIASNTIERTWKRLRNRGTFQQNLTADVLRYYEQSCLTKTNILEAGHEQQLQELAEHGIFVDSEDLISLLLIVQKCTHQANPSMSESPLSSCPCLPKPPSLALASRLSKNEVLGQFFAAANPQDLELLQRTLGQLGSLDSAPDASVPLQPAATTSTTFDCSQLPPPPSQPVTAPVGPHSAASKVNS